MMARAVKYISYALRIRSWDGNEGMTICEVAGWKRYN